MFESAEIEHDIDKASFEERLPQLRTDILNAQFEVLEARDFPVILLLGGMEGTGLIDALTNAYTVLDARHVIASAFDKPTGEEKDRTRMWRFWQALPPRGEMGVYIGAWYSTPLTRRILGKSRAAVANTLRLLDLDTGERTLAVEPDGSRSVLALPPITTYAVVVFSILVQGLTIGPLVASTARH